MVQVISQCPICGKQLKVVKLHCDNCDTMIENNFSLSKFDYLSKEDLHFAETFLKCRGNIKEVEKELKISYPTVRSRLDDIILQLDAKHQPSMESCQKEVLDALENGEITPAEAITRIKKQK